MGRYGRGHRGKSGERKKGKKERSRTKARANTAGAHGNKGSRAGCERRKNRRGACTGRGAKVEKAALVWQKIERREVILTRLRVSFPTYPGQPSPEAARVHACSVSARLCLTQKREYHRASPKPSSQMLHRL